MEKLLQNISIIALIVIMFLGKWGALIGAAGLLILSYRLLIKDGMEDDHYEEDSYEEEYVCSAGRTAKEDPTKRNRKSDRISRSA